jgi:tungstate transport system substrate-binding protein
MHKSRKILNLFLVLVLAVGLVGLISGCSSGTTTTPTVTTTSPVTTATTAPATTTPAPTTVTPPENPELIMASTTSTRDSGLMDVLIPVFEKETGYKVKPVYVGTGAAIKMGQDGNADVLLVHAPSQEKTFMDSGYGINRKLIMHNDFIIVGPPNDPAGIKGMTSAPDAFKKIADAQATFYSRGDKSGTDTAEKAIWKKIGVTVADNATSNPSWYMEGGAGTGMLDLLRISTEKNAYTLTDRSTYLANKTIVGLDIMVQGDPSLLNIYHVIEVNPEKYPKVNSAGAKAFSAFMVSKEAQDIIAAFGADKYGQPLFFADAGKTEASLGSY